MADLATLGLRLEATQFQQSAATVRRELDGVATSAERTQQKITQSAQQGARAQERIAQESAARQRVIAQQSGRQAAIAQMQALEQQFQRDQARVKEDLVRGLLSPAQAKEAGRLNAIAYNDGILQTLNKGGGKLGAEAYAQVAGSLKSVDAATKGATRGFGELRESAASVAAQMVGVHPIFGRLANVMGGFAVGSVMMVGVLAGIALLGAAFKKLTEPLREAKKWAEDALAALKRVADQQRNTESAEINRGLVEAEQRRAVLASKLRTGLTGWDISGRKTRMEYEELGREIEAGERRLAEIMAEGKKKQNETWEAAQKERLNSAKKAQQELIDAQKEAEQRYEVELQALVKGLTYHTATADEIMRARGEAASLREIVLDTTRSLEDRNQAYERMRSLVDAIATRESEMMLKAPNIGGAFPMQGTVDAGLDTSAAAWENMRQWASSGSGGGLNLDFSKIGSTIMAGVGQAVGQGLTKVFTSTFQGLLSGGPVAAASALINGLTGELFGLNDATRRAREETRQLRIALQDSLQERMIEAYGDDSRSAELRRLQQERGQRVLDAEKAYSGRLLQQQLDTIDDVFSKLEEQMRAKWAAEDAAEAARIADQVSKATEQARRAREQFAGDLAAFWAELSGGGEIARLQQQQAAQMQAALDLYNAGTITEDMLKSLAEALNVQLQQAIAAVQARLDEVRNSLQGEFGARGAALRGDDAMAQIIRYQMQMAEDAKRLGEAMVSGAISTEQMNEWLAILNGELAKFKENLAAAAEAAAAASVENDQRMRESLTSRSLRATGRGAQADEYDLFARQRQEMYDARERSPELRAFLQLVHGQETAAYFQQRAIEAQTEAIKAAAEAQVKALDAQITVAQDQLKVAQDSLREQERSVEATERLVESLTRFSAGLALGSLTTLSPVAQLDEARRQFNTVLAGAQGGDLAAATALPEIAQRLLEASRGVNASGLGYARDYDMVKGAVDAVAARFGNQLTTDQQILEQLKKQTESLTAQIDELRAARDSAMSNAQAQIDAITNSTAAADAAMQQAIDAARANAERAEAELQRQLDTMAGVAVNTGFNAQQSGLMVQHTLAMFSEIQNLRYTDMAAANQNLRTIAGFVDTSVMVQQDGFKKTVERLDSLINAVITGDVNIVRALQEKA